MPSVKACIVAIDPLTGLKLPSFGWMSQQLILTVLILRYGLTYTIHFKQLLKQRVVKNSQQIINNNNRFKNTVTKILKYKVNNFICMLLVLIFNI